jgi:CBS domain-containing protein
MIKGGIAMLIKDIMIKDVISVKTTDTVDTCAGLLYKHGISGLTVLDEDGKLVGIVTEGDLIRRESKVRGPAVLEILGGIIYLDSPKKYIDDLKHSMGQLVSDVMTSKVITISEDAEVEDAATLLVQKKIKRLPVVNSKGDLVGIVARRDIMSYLFPPNEN